MWMELDPCEAGEVGLKKDEGGMSREEGEGRRC